MSTTTRPLRAALLLALFLLCLPLVAVAGTPAPTISGTPATTATWGFPYSFTPTATDALFFTIDGTLPPGLTFDSRTGTLSGMPIFPGAVDTLVKITIRAVNSSGAAALTFTLTVLDPSAATTERDSFSSHRLVLSAPVGTPFSYKPGYQYPDSAGYIRSVTGIIPPGLSCDPVTSVLSGTPTAAGTYKLVFNSTNPAGGSDPYYATISAPLTLYITSDVAATVVQATNSGSLSNGFYVAPLAIARTTPPTIYTVGESPYGYQVQKSSDDGASWSFVTNGLPGPSTLGADRRVIALASDPNNPQTIFAATWVGIYVTTNGGDSWSELSVGLPGAGMKIDSLIVAPANPARFYISTGNGTNSGIVYQSSGEGAGITWSVATSFAGSITAMAFNPADPANLVISVTDTTTTQVFGWNPAKEVFSLGSYGEPTSDLILYRPVIRMLAIAPSEPTSVYATDGGNLTHIYALVYSIGRTFNRAPGYNDRLPANGNAVAIHPSNPMILYATQYNGLIMSSDGGNTWSTRLQAGDITNLVFAADGNPRKLYAAGSAGLFIIHSSPTISGPPLNSATVGVPYSFTPRSSDAAAFTVSGALPPGLTFDSATGTLSGTPDGEGIYGNIVISAANDLGTVLLPPFAITVNPPLLPLPTISGPDVSNASVGVPYRYATTSGNAASFSMTGTLPAGLAFDSATGSLSGTPVSDGVYDIIINASNSGGTAQQKLLLICTPLGNAWQQVSSGLPAGAVFSSIAVDPLDPRIVYAATGGGIATVIAGTGIYKSSNGGASWIAINSGLTTENSLSVRNVLIDPSTPQTLYAETNGGVFKSINGGASWVVIKAGNIPYFIIDPLTPQTLYVANYKSTDGGATWNQITNISNKKIYGLAADRSSTPATLYAATNGGVYKSSDDGVVWADSGLTKPAYSIASDPSTTPATLYATTSYGMYTSSNAGISWSLLHFDLPLSNNPFGIDSSTTPATLYFANLSGVYRSTNSNGYWSQLPNQVTIFGIAPSDNRIVYTAGPQGIYRSGAITVLTVNTVTPAGGVPVAVTPPDQVGLSNGVSSFSRVYAAGQFVTLTAPVSAGGPVGSWSGCDTVVGQQCQVTMGASRVVTLTSAPSAGYNVIFAAAAGGSLSGSTNQLVTAGAGTTAVTAVAEAGYYFSGWSGVSGAEATSNPLTLTNITQNRTISATFSTIKSQSISFGMTTVRYSATPLDLATLASGGGSGNPLTFVLLSGPGSLSGANNATLTMTGLGSIVLRASQAGSTAYTAAPDLQQSITVMNCAPRIAELAGWWKAEDDAIDSVGSNNGTLNGSTTYATGKSGQAFSFNGVSDYIAQGSSYAATVINNFTMEFWAKPAGTITTVDVSGQTTSGAAGTVGQRYAIFPEKGASDTTAGVGVSVATNGILVVEHAASYMPTVLVYPVVAGDIAADGWMHIAVVYDNKRPKLYVNGVWKKDGATGTRTVHPSSNFGENGQGYGYYKGALDEVHIFNRALTPAEIMAFNTADSNGICQSYPISTRPAGNITTGGATLNATVNAHNISTAVSFEYGLTTAYGTTISVPTALSGVQDVSVTAAISGLTYGSSYHYRVIGTSVDGKSYGNDISFSTTQVWPLTISVNGSGSGTVTSDLQHVGIGCPSMCEETYLPGDLVTLSNFPSGISTFNGWIGDSGCVAKNSCTVSMDRARNITASFNAAPLAKNKSYNYRQYAALDAALTDTARAGYSGDEILLLGAPLSGAVTLTKSFILNGGWDATFDGLNGQDTSLADGLTVLAGDSKVANMEVYGKLTVQGGSLRVNGVKVRSGYVKVK